LPRAAAIPASERRAHAVRVLLELARTTAPDAISTAAIAERMGVSHGALFRHFPSREALWAEAVSWATGELERRFDACLEPPPPAPTPVSASPADPSAGLPPSGPLNQVAALMASHAGLLQQHPGLVRMLFAELQRPATSPARETGKAFMQRFRLRLATLMGAAQADGDLAPDLDPHELADLLVATQQGLMLQALVHDGFADLTDRSRRCVALFLRAGPGLPQALEASPAAAPGEGQPERASPPAGTHRRRPAGPPGGPPAD
jgi:TetR/AcrR family transcriptional regulator